jgi:hypothetical protein
MQENAINFQTFNGTGILRSSGAPKAEGVGGAAGLQPPSPARSKFEKHVLYAR